MGYCCLILGSEASALVAGLVELVGEDVLCSVVGGGADARFAADEAIVRLSGWAARYDAAARRDHEAELAAIGREMFEWLDDAGWASGWADAPGGRELEVRVAGRDDAREATLLDAPWELIARGGAPLALDDVRPLAVLRRIGPLTPPRAPDRGDLQLMFMAAAPEGQTVLDFEAEEAAILEVARGDGRIHVVVEETGALEALGGRLTSDEGPFEALHLSCHGEILTEQGPVLLLETAEVIQRAGDDMFARYIEFPEAV